MEIKQGKNKTEQNKAPLLSRYEYTENILQNQNEI